MNIDSKKVLAKSQKLNHWSAQKLYYDIGKNHQRSWSVKRGEVYFVNLGETIGKERIVSSVICCLSPTEMKEIDLKLFNALGLSTVITSKNNTIESLKGKIEYLNSQRNNAKTNNTFDTH